MLGMPCYSCPMSMGYFSCFWLQGGEDAFVLAFVPLILCISHVSVCRDECGRHFLPLAWGTPLESVLAPLCLPATAYRWRRGCIFPRKGKKWGRVVLPWWPQLAWSPALTPPCGSLWLQRWRCWGLASSLFHELCSPLFSSLPAFYRVRLTSKILSKLLPSCRNPPITTSLLSPLRLRGGGDVKERNVSVPLNLIATKIADTLPSQTCRSPHLFACAQKISSLFFTPLFSSWYNSFSHSFSVWYIHFPGLGVAWKDFDPLKDKINKRERFSLLFPPCLPCCWGSKGGGK